MANRNLGSCLRKRHLLFESLESRRVLDAVSVEISDDVDDAPSGLITISQLEANKGADGKISLREAIRAANSTPGHDTIGFNVNSVSLDSFLTVTDPVEIKPSGLRVVITPSSSYTGNQEAFHLHPSDTGGSGDFNAASTITLSRLDILDFVQPIRISGHGSAAPEFAVPESVIITDNDITTAGADVFTLKSPTYALVA